jgi:hypothetical protein
MTITFLDLCAWHRMFESRGHDGEQQIEGTSPGRNMWTSLTQSSVAREAP